MVVAKLIAQALVAFSPTPRDSRQAAAMQRLSGNAAGAMRHAATAPAAPHPAVAQRMRSTVARAVIIDPSGLTSGGQQGEPAAPGPGSLLADAPLPPGVVKVPVSELPKPHPKAQKTLSKSTSKTGVYQALVDTLNSVSFTVACDDPDLGWEVAQGLAKRIGWFPVSTARILAGMHKALPATAAATGQEGSGQAATNAVTAVGARELQQLVLEACQGSTQELVKGELGVLAGLRSQRRVVASVLPGGALSDPAAWREVYGSFIVWIEEVEKGAPGGGKQQPTPAEVGAQRRLLKERAEVMVRLKKGRGFSAGGGGTVDKARTAVDALLRDLVSYLNANPDLIERKVNYVARGCRGDWPNVQPASWSPVLEGLGRAPAAPAGEQAAAASPSA